MRWRGEAVELFWDTDSAGNHGTKNLSCLDQTVAISSVMWIRIAYFLPSARFGHLCREKEKHFLSLVTLVT